MVNFVKKEKTFCSRWWKWKLRLLMKCKMFFYILEYVNVHIMYRVSKKTTEKKPAILSLIIIIEPCSLSTSALDLCFISIRYTVCLKKETGTNMPISLKVDKHLNNFGCYLLEGYLLFPTVPRNVG